MSNLSLSGCGFLGIYHIGVISAFREHAADFLQGKIAGCSAGSLVAACAISDCCLGQMVSDVLEIALKARSHALGPLHPSFSIVDILRNGLRRILPVDAHKICSGRLYISLTRWKDGKNFLVNQFESREELIQALICSSFVPFYSGVIPPKFKGVYYWDGGLSNNNPILDENTVLVSPFGGESDICPRDESGSFYCSDFKGTNVQWSQENIYRMSKALFPPDPETLKAICFRGYKDSVNYLKSRNLLQCSCNRFFREKMSISSVIGEEINDFNIYESELEDEANYDSEEDKIIQYADSNEPLRYEEMPATVWQILDTACNDNKGLLYGIYNSQISRAISIMFLPWTLPIEFSFNFTKRLLELMPKFEVSQDSSNLVDTFLIYLNFIIQKLTYDKYQYHARVSCKLCVPRSRSLSSGGQMMPFKICCHSESKATFDDNVSEVRSSIACSSSYHTKLCARHRVPSVCGSEPQQQQQQQNGSLRKYRSRSFVSNRSDVASSADLSELSARGSSRSLFSRRYRKNSHPPPRKSSNFRHSRQSLKSFDKLAIDEETNHSSSIESKILLIAANNAASTVAAATNTVSVIQPSLQSAVKHRPHKESATRVVHFHLNHDDEDDDENKPNKHLKIEEIQEKPGNLTDDTKSSQNEGEASFKKQIDQKNEINNLKNAKFTNAINENSLFNTEKRLASSTNLDNSLDSKNNSTWDDWEDYVLNGKI